MHNETVLTAESAMQHLRLEPQTIDSCGVDVTRCWTATTEHPVRITFDGGAARVWPRGRGGTAREAIAGLRENLALIVEDIQGRS